MDSTLPSSLDSFRAFSVACWGAGVALPRQASVLLPIHGWWALGLRGVSLFAWQMVLLSAVAGDPSPETIEAAQGYTLLRTDRNGWIELTTDGERLWVEVKRR